MKDPRFSIANREACIGIALVLVNFAIWFGFAYGLGSADYSDYSYILGFPAWFFYSTMAGTVFMIVTLGIILKLFFKDVPFDDEGDDDK
ncbi:MAG TPA: YhdT family protein [Savagea sp.]